MISDAERLARCMPIVVVADGTLALWQPALWNELIGVSKVSGGAIDGERSNGKPSL